MFNNIPPFGTRGILTFDIAIASYTIYPFILFFYILLYMYIRGRGYNGPPTPIIIQQLPAEKAGSVWDPPFLDYVFTVYGDRAGPWILREGIQ